MEREYHITSKAMQDAIQAEFGTPPYSQNNVDKIEQFRSIVEGADTLSVFEESVKCEEVSGTPMNDDSISLDESIVNKLINERDYLKLKIDETRLNLYHDIKNRKLIKHVEIQLDAMEKYYSALVWRIGDMIGK